MSEAAAVIEPPVVTPPAEVTPPVVETPPAPAPTQKPTTVQIPGSIAELIREQNQKLPGKKKEELSKTEVKQEVKAEVKPPVVTEPPKEKDNSKEINFARLREEKESLAAQKKAADEQLATLRTELEALKQRPAVEDVQKEREELNKQIAELRTNLKGAALQRDPEFQAKYDSAIEGKMKSIVALAVQSGVEQKDALAAVQGWSKASFNEWISGMTPLDQAQFANLVSSTEELDRERGVQIKEADKRWDEQQKSREEAQKAQQTQFQKSFQAEADQTVEEIFTDEVLAKDTELREQVKTEIKMATMLHPDRYSRKEVLQRVAHAAILGKVAAAQQAAIAELRTEAETKDKKIAELEEFVSRHRGSAPPLDGGNGSAAKGDDNTPIWNRIVVKV
jgi:hypothetical protein